MKNKGYKDQNNKSYGKKIIVLFVMIFILCILNIILTNINKEDEKVELSYDNLTTVQEVIEYYKSIYIKEEKSKDSDFYLDIYLNFTKQLYENNENSNEEYYNNIIKDVAKVLYYQSFRMFDEKNNINIDVICKNRKINKIIINGMEDYFIYNDSQISMKKYKEIESINLNITSPILQECIDNNWEYNINFGTRESIFNEYYIYFDEGIKTRIIKDKIYNIVFDKKYGNNVVGNLFPGVDFKTIESTLGKPAFEDKELNVIGYKGNQIYIFFTENEISVYRIINDDTDDFFKLVDEYLESKIDLLEFMNQLTYMWTDYSDYVYTTDSIFLAYPLKGIEIKINYDDTNGILVYNNIKSSLSKVNRYLENTEFIARLQIDSVFESEKRRLHINETLIEKCDEYTKTLDDKQKDIIGENLKYSIYVETDNNNSIYSIKFISTTGNNPNRELNDSINSYLWIDSDTFIYSKSRKGIFLYDLKTGNVKRILEGEEKFEFKSYSDGLLKYDKDEVIVQY